MEFQFLLINAALLFCFNLQGQTYQDCINPYPICELTSYHFEMMTGHGKFQDKMPESRCTSNHKLKEKNSKWLFFEVWKSGTLVWNFEARDAGDEIDFILFKMAEDCTGLEEVFCLKSSEIILNKINTKSNDTGDSGLKFSSLDDFENSELKFGNDSFLNFLAVKQDEKYVIMINNPGSTKGFSISFDGNCKLRQAINCKRLEFNLRMSNPYLNPLSQTLITNFNSISDTYTLKLLDARGIILREEKGKCKSGLNTLNIDITHLPSGIFAIHIAQSGLKASRIFAKDD